MFAPPPNKGRSVFLGREEPLSPLAWGAAPRATAQPGDHAARFDSRRACGWGCPVPTRSLRTWGSAPPGPAGDRLPQASARVSLGLPPEEGLSGNSDPCPRALMGRINPIVFKPRPSPCKLPRSPLPAPSLRLVCVRLFPSRPSGFAGRGLLAHFKAAQGVGQRLDQGFESCSALSCACGRPLPLWRPTYSGRLASTW